MQEDFTKPEIGLFTSDSFLEKKVSRSSVRRCAGCGASVGRGLLGKGFGARFCEYTRLYYCHECHANELFVIPARVLHRFDIKPRPVCREAFAYLEDLYPQPIFSASGDLRPRALALLPSLPKLAALRRQGKTLREYLALCPNFPSNRCSQEERVQAASLGGRNHLLTSEDMLSLQDLVELDKDALLRQLEAAFAPWILHVKTKCLLCTEKGFFCEVCRSREKLYPFELEGVASCEDCGALMHPRCKATRLAVEGCGLCERRRRQEQRRREEEEEAAERKGVSTGRFPLQMSVHGNGHEHVWPDRKSVV